MIRLVIATIMQLDYLLNLLSSLVKNDNVGKRNPAALLGLPLQTTIFPCSLIAPPKTKTSLEAPFSLSSLMDQNQLISSPLCRDRAKYYPHTILTITVRSITDQSQLGL